MGMEAKSAFAAYKNTMEPNNTKTKANKKSSAARKKSSKSPSTLEQVLEKRKREISAQQELEDPIGNNDGNSSTNPKKKRKLSAKKNAKKVAEEVLNSSLQELHSKVGDKNVKKNNKTTRNPKQKIPNNAIDNAPVLDNEVESETPNSVEKKNKKVKKPNTEENKSLSLELYLSSLLSSDSENDNAFEKKLTIKKEIDDTVTEEQEWLAPSSNKSKSLTVETKKGTPKKANKSLETRTPKKKKHVENDETIKENGVSETPENEKKDIKNTPRKSESLKSATPNKSSQSLTDLPKPKKNIKAHKKNSHGDILEEETSSIEEGENLFKWLIHPVTLTDFYKETWEKRPLHIGRKCQSYYQNLISSVTIDKMLREERIEYTKNIDITSYINGVRETRNPTGRALPPAVWDFYLNGCSVRLLNPQTYIQKLNLLCATLQEYFVCMVGANSYLTPPDSQGFAPHYDDIEAFVIQIEGKKHWKLYAPRTPSETLPRVSSPNFSPSEIGEPIMDVILCPGDLLYFPRGTIHQANTVEAEHSLHITLSVYQKHSWGDLLETLLPGMLATAINDDVSFREGLPLDISNNLGLLYSDMQSSRRTVIINKLKELIDKMTTYAPFDAGVDQFFKQYQHNALSPVLTAQQRECTVFGDGEVIGANGQITNRVEFSPETRVKLIRANILRMVMEDDTIRLYYHIDNLKEYQGIELQFVDIDDTLAPAVEQLIKAYPKYVAVSDLDIQKDDSKLTFAEALWTKGLLMTSQPLDCIDE